MTKLFTRSSILMALLSVVVPFSIASAKTVKPAKVPVKTAAKAPVKAEAKSSAAVVKGKSKARTVEKTHHEAVKAGRKGTDRHTQSKAEHRKTDWSEHKKSPKKAASAYFGSSGMRIATLHAGGAAIRAEVASTESQHEKGLMYRKSLPANSGMLFDFKAPAKTCMWMKNTYIPLSVAFIDAHGKVVNIEEMKAMTTTTHCSKDWIRYALEMNAKWFSKHGVKRGSHITGLPH